jgi:hypothetical protein
MEKEMKTEIWDRAGFAHTRLDGWRTIPFLALRTGDLFRLTNRDGSPFTRDGHMTFVAKEFAYHYKGLCGVVAVAPSPDVPECSQKFTIEFPEHYMGVPDSIEIKDEDLHNYCKIMKKVCTQGLHNTGNGRCVPCPTEKAVKEVPFYKTFLELVNPALTHGTISDNVLARYLLTCYEAFEKVRINYQ